MAGEAYSLGTLYFDSAVRFDNAERQIAQFEGRLKQMGIGVGAPGGGTSQGMLPGGSGAPPSVATVSPGAMAGIRAGGGNATVSPGATSAVYPSTRTGGNVNFGAEPSIVNPGMSMSQSVRVSAMEARYLKTANAYSAQQQFKQSLADLSMSAAAQGGAASSGGVNFAEPGQANPQEYLNAPMSGSEAQLAAMMTSGGGKGFFGRAAGFLTKDIIPRRALGGHFSRMASRFIGPLAAVAGAYDIINANNYISSGTQSTILGQTTGDVLAGASAMGSAGFSGIIGGATGFALDAFASGPQALARYTQVVGAGAAAISRSSEISIARNQYQALSRFQGSTAGQGFNFAARSSAIEAGRLTSLNRVNNDLSAATIGSTVADYKFLGINFTPGAQNVAQMQVNNLRSERRNINAGASQEQRQLNDDIALFREQVVRQTAVMGASANIIQMRLSGDSAGATISEITQNRSIERARFASELRRANPTISRSEIIDSLDAFDSETSGLVSFGKRGLVNEGVQLAYAATGTRQAREGFSADARITQINASLGVRMFAGGMFFQGGEVGPGDPRYAGYTDFRNEQIRSARIEENQATISSQGMASVTAQLTSGQPFNARRVSALNDFIAATRPLAFNSPAFKNADRAYQDTQTRIDFDEKSTRAQVFRGQEVERMELLAAGRFDPIGGRAAGIFGAARERAAALAKNGFDGAAQTELDYGRVALGLEQASYLRGFRGEQIDLRNIDVTNPRDKENPAEVLTTIRDLLDKLVNTKLDQLIAG